MSGISNGRSGRRLFGAAALLLGVLLLVLVLSTAGAAQSAERVIHLQTADLSLRPGVFDTGGGRYAVVHLERNLLRAEMDALAADGVRLLSWLGDGAFIAAVEPGALTDEATAAYGIRAAAPWTAAHKATAELRRGAIDPAARTAGGQLKVSVLFFADVARSEMEAVLGRHTTTYTMQTPLVWSVAIAPAELAGLLAEPPVRFASPSGLNDLPLNDIRAVMHVEEVQQATIFDDPPAVQYAGLTGEGITLQVGESVWDGHPDFIDENGVSRFDPPTPEEGCDPMSGHCYHGTWSAGVMAGDGMYTTELAGTPFFRPAGYWRGMAPEATLHEAIYAGGQGRFIDAANFTNGWYWSTNYYDFHVGVDGNVRGDNGFDMQFPHVFAAHNYGLENGYYSVLAPTKNGIVVGGINANDGSLWSDSSLGPTQDGRIKPEVMAPASKNYQPPDFDIATDPILVSVDYIHIIDLDSGNVTKSWDFDIDGDDEGWSANGDNVSNVQVADGRLSFQKIGLGGGIHNVGNFSFVSNPGDVIRIRYQVNSTAGPLAGSGSVGWGSDEVPVGWINFKFDPASGWRESQIYVGSYGLEMNCSSSPCSVVGFGGWTGTVTALGYFPLESMGCLMVPSIYDTGEEEPFECVSGTSESAPAVTGAVGLLLQQFRDAQGLDLDVNPPLPSTVKAVLIQTAEDMIHTSADPRDPDNIDTGAPTLYYEGPDFATGYGRVNVLAAVNLIGDDPGPGAAARLIHEGELDGDDLAVYEFDLTPADVAALGDLKFTLAWDDYPGDPSLPSTQSVLVNDLDLLLIGPDGTVHRPWVLPSLPYYDQDILPEDVQPAYKGADHLNNVEMVQVDDPMPGHWQAMIVISDMPFPLQTYSLVGNDLASLTSLGDNLGVTFRVSLNSFWGEANHASRYSDISADGSVVAFSSYADNLVPGDNNGMIDVFVRDLPTAITTLVSVNAGDKQGNGHSDHPAITADGRYVVFQSDATNLVPADKNEVTDVFIYDQQTGQISRVSVSSAGEAGNGASRSPALSDDGRYVVFHSDATNLVSGDTNGVDDVFVRDRQTGQTTRVSVGPGGAQGNSRSILGDISSDGRLVVFESDADNLVADDTNGVRDVFLHDRNSGTTTRLSVSWMGEQANDSSSSAAISANGRDVVFRSDANNLAPGDNNGAGDVFVRSVPHQWTMLESVNSAQQQANSDTEYPSRPTISGDGRYVVFDSDADNLVPGDIGGFTDVFLRDRLTRTTTLISVNSSGGFAQGLSSDPVIAANAHFVSFYSDAANLVSGDNNGWGDIFVHAWANQPPQAIDQSVNVPFNQAVSIMLEATDPEEDPLTFAVMTGPQHGQLSGAAPDLTYTPAAGYSGPDSFSFKANDGHSDSNVATVSITVAPATGWRVHLPFVKR